MYCIKCGNELKENVVFCPKCGSKVEDDETIPVDNNGANEKKTTAHKKLSRKLVIIIALIVIVLVGAIVGGIVGYKVYQDKKHQEEVESFLKSIEEARENAINGYNDRINQIMLSLNVEKDGSSSLDNNDDVDAMTNAVNELNNVSNDVNNDALILQEQKDELNGNINGQIDCVNKRINVVNEARAEAERQAKALAEAEEQRQRANSNSSYTSSNSKSNSSKKQLSDNQLLQYVGVAVVEGTAEQFGWSRNLGPSIGYSYKGNKASILIDRVDRDESGVIKAYGTYSNRNILGKVITNQGHPYKSFVVTMDTTVPGFGYYWKSGKAVFKGMYVEFSDIDPY